MPLSTTNIRIVSVSFSYCSPIVLLLFSYCSPIILLLFSYRSPIVLLLGNGKQYGNDTGLIRNRTKDERMRIGGTRVVNLTIISNFLLQWQDSNKLLGCQHAVYRRKKIQ